MILDFRIPDLQKKTTPELVAVVDCGDPLVGQRGRWAFLVIFFLVLCIGFK